MFARIAKGKINENRGEAFRPRKTIEEKVGEGWRTRRKNKKTNNGKNSWRTCGSRSPVGEALAGLIWKHRKYGTSQGYSDRHYWKRLSGGEWSPGNADRGEDHDGDSQNRSFHEGTKVKDSDKRSGRSHSKPQEQSQHLHEPQPLRNSQTSNQNGKDRPHKKKNNKNTAKGIARKQTERQSEQKKKRTKKAIEPPGDDGRCDPAKAGTRRRSPTRSVVTKLNRPLMTSTTTVPNTAEKGKEAKKKLPRKWRL